MTCLFRTLDSKFWLYTTSHIEVYILYLENSKQIKIEIEKEWFWTFCLNSLVKITISYIRLKVRIYICL